MTWQAIVGVVFVLIGLAIKVAQAAGLLGAGEIGMVGEISNLGMLLIGKELIPGSAQSLAVSSRASKLPPVALALPLMFLLGGCASWGDVKPVARDVNNIARDLCEATMGSEAQRQGIGVKELCAISYIIAPFLEAPHLASANAVLGRELEAPRCTP